MRIALFIPKLTPGGAERVLLALSEQFVRRGFDCDLVCAIAGGVWQPRVPEGVRLVDLNRKRPLLAVPALYNYLRREKPAVLLSSITSANIAALLATRMPGIRTRCVIRDANLIEKDIVDASRFRTWVSTLAVRALFKRADAIITLSKGLRDNLCSMVGLPPERITIIANPWLRTSGPTSSEESAQVGPGQTHPLIVACGRLAPQKDYPTLLRAFSLVRKQTQARLVILGEGPSEAELKAQAEALGLRDDVEFIGHSADPASWMRRAAVFVLTSRWEGFPNVLLEALGCDCPIVATDCSDAVSEVLGDGRFGAIRQVGDAPGIAGSILAIIAGTKKFERAGTQLLRYDLDTVVDRYLTVLLGTQPPNSKFTA